MRIVTLFLEFRSKVLDELHNQVTLSMEETFLCYPIQTCLYLFINGNDTIRLMKM